MTSKHQALADWVNALSLRERVILSAVIAVTILFIWLQAIYLPWEHKQSLLGQSERHFNSEMISTKAELSGLKSAKQNDPNIALKEERQALRKQVAEQQAYINRTFAQLMSPEQMSTTLADLLADFEGMTLLDARNLPVQALKLAGDDSDLKGSREAESLIYQHGFEMSLEGRYFDAVRLLQSLEQLGGFYWHRIDYKVDDYPKATLTLQLQTLSLHEDWIGV